MLMRVFKLNPGLPFKVINNRDDNLTISGYILTEKLF